MTIHELKLVKDNDALYKAYYDGAHVRFHQAKKADFEDNLEILDYCTTKSKALLEAIEGNEELIENCIIENKYYKEALRKMGGAQHDV